jgi:Ohr subfamily peroxiredoxin
MRAFAVGRFGETERRYHKLIYWHEAEEGGHFAAWEQPEIVAVELRALIAAPIAQPAWKGTHTMSQLEKVLYTTKTHTSGGRDGASRSIDGHLDVKLSRPGGPGGGTNPEQLFTAGWWACFMNSMQLVAGKMKVALPTDLAIDAEVDLGPTGDGSHRRHDCYAVSLRWPAQLRGCRGLISHSIAPRKSVRRMASILSIPMEN